MWLQLIATNVSGSFRMKRPGMNESQRKKNRKKPLQNPKLHQQKTTGKNKSHGWLLAANLLPTPRKMTTIMILSKSVSQSTSGVSQTPQNQSGVTGFHFSACQLKRCRDAAPSNIIDLQHYKNPQSRPQHQQSLRAENPCQQRKWTAVHLKHYKQRRNLHNVDRKKKAKESHTVCHHSHIAG